LVKNNKKAIKVREIKGRAELENLQPGNKKTISWDWTPSLPNGIYYTAICLTPKDYNDVYTEDRSDFTCTKLSDYIDVKSSWWKVRQGE
jgi:hypothetical protein